VEAVTPGFEALHMTTPLGVFGLLALVVGSIWLHFHPRPPMPTFKHEERPYMQSMAEAIADMPDATPEQTAAWQAYMGQQAQDPKYLRRQPPLYGSTEQKSWEEKHVQP
jgi:hypothetical protein